MVVGAALAFDSSFTTAFAAPVFFGGGGVQVSEINTVTPASWGSLGLGLVLDYRFLLHMCVGGGDTGADDGG
jgi:hypothetical protein